MIEKKQKGKDFIIKHFNISECGQKLYFIWFKYIKMVMVMKTSIVEKQVDALIKGGYYLNRAEFVKDAIRAFFELRKEMKIVAAVELYKKEEVSISKAAELAGLNIEEMKRVLADRGVEIKRGFTKNRKTAASALSEMMR
ncbi:MAG TPA: hypothetical protein C5S37_00115 [Methanophagales archaeon]|nr:hypothetical protein [Methanophagales archaeon]